MSHLRNLEESLLDTNSLYSTRLADREPEEILSLSSSDVSDLPFLFPFHFSSCASSLRQSSYAVGSSRQLKEVTLYSHARQGETP